MVLKVSLVVAETKRKDSSYGYLNCHFLLIEKLLKVGMFESPRIFDFVFEILHVFS